MSEFVARWSTWAEPTPDEISEMPDQVACKTSESSAGNSEMRVQPASKTSKTPFAGFAGSLPGHSGEESGFAGVAAMTLDEFAQKGLVVQVNSVVLGREVLFVSDNVPDDELAARDSSLIYRTDELRKLAICRPRPHDLRTLHDVKTIFDGTITNVRKRDDHALKEA